MPCHGRQSGGAALLKAHVKRRNTGSNFAQLRLQPISGTIANEYGITSLECYASKGPVWVRAEIILCEHYML